MSSIRTHSILAAALSCLVGIAAAYTIERTAASTSGATSSTRAASTSITTGRAATRTPEPPKLQPVWTPPPPTTQSPASIDPDVLVITSDPQYPWTPHDDDNKVPACADEHACSRALIQAQYDSINRFARGKRVLGTFINGDLTAYGHPWQVDHMRGAVAQLKTPVFLGLGNHDYQNNMNDCAENWCVRYTMYWFREHMAKMGLDALDLQTERYYRFPSIHEDTRGSFGWVKRFGDLTIVQVNNYPEYTAWGSGWSFERGLREVIDVRSSLQWADEQLRKARERDDVILVMMHDPGVSDAFADVLERHQVSAVFAGHLHKTLGFRKMAGDAPVFTSGAASQQTYLITERTGNRMLVWQVEGNNESARALIAEVGLKARRYAQVVPERPEAGLKQINPGSQLQLRPR